MTLSSPLLRTFIIAYICAECLSFTLHRSGIPAHTVRADHVQKFQGQHFLKMPVRTRGHTHSRDTSKRIMNDEYSAESDNRKDAGGNNFTRLWNEYGPLYFQVWFCIYLPFLISFFYILDNNLLATTPFHAFDPQVSILKLFTWLEKVSGDPELMSGVRENPRATTFATAYLMADLVPTSFFAVAATVAIKLYQKKAEPEE